MKGTVQLVDNPNVHLKMYVIEHEAEPAGENVWVNTYRIPIKDWSSVEVFVALRTDGRNIIVDGVYKDEEKLKEDKKKLQESLGIDDEEDSGYTWETIKTTLK